MPLGIVSDEDFQKELDNSATKTVVVVPPPSSNHDMEPSKDDEVGPIITSDAIIKRFGQGRHLGDVNVPHSLRKVIGEQSSIEGRQAGLELANSFGISPASVSAYQSPENSSQLSESNKENITEFLIGRKQKLSKRALNKLNMAMVHITDDKLKDLKATDLSSVAKNMAEVARKMEPEVKDERKDPVQFVIFAPQVNNEANYQTVVAKDNY